MRDRPPEGGEREPGVEDVLDDQHFPTRERRGIRELDGGNAGLGVVPVGGDPAEVEGQLHPEGAEAAGEIGGEDERTPQHHEQVEGSPRMARMGGGDLPGQRLHPLGDHPLGKEFFGALSGGAPRPAQLAGKRPKVTLMTPTASTGFPSFRAGFQR